MRYNDERKMEYAKKMEEKRESISKSEARIQASGYTLVKYIWEIPKELKVIKIEHREGNNV